jgi:hypothetical protein
LGIHRPRFVVLGGNIQRYRGILAALVLTTAVVKAKSATHSPVSLAKKRSSSYRRGGVQSFLGARQKASHGLDSSVGGLTV